MSAPGVDPDAVLSWGVPRLRDLPWRDTRDPWAVLVAEVMLQQTQVDRVIPKWERFLEVYPTPRDCAAASLGDVLRMWQGLGYPRRARNLHATATEVCISNGGRLPDSLDELLALPGIGPYTARAVLVFACERDLGVVDTNIARILARSAGERLTAKQAQVLADSLVPPERGWTWNQVFMDLGALVCRPRPRCADCPVAPACAWMRAGHPDPDPAIGSAGVSSKQPRFEGSDRQHRGLVLAALGDGPRPVAEFDDRIVAGLLADGLIERRGAGIQLPMSAPRLLPSSV